MNYGKRKTAKQHKKLSNKKGKQGKRLGLRLIKAFLLIIILVGIAGVVACGMFAKSIIDDSPTISADDVKPQGYTTFVYADDNKTQIETLVAAGSNRVYKSIDEIPIQLQHAFVAIEDVRFYEHNGIDLQGIARAAVVGLTSGDFSEGASTLTQQLIKNNVFPNFTEEKTFSDRLKRKIQEQYLAVQIEKQMSKDEIMEAYLNTINLGQNCLGVQAAAQRYFNKNVEDLTLSECAVIAGITKNPSHYNPVTDPEANAKRREKVLSDMLEQGYITQEEYDEAEADDVYARIQQVSSEMDTSPYSYFIDALTDQVINDLQDQLGYTETQAYNALYSGGLTIYSTQNVEIQKICDEEMNDDDNYPWLKEWGLDYALTVTRADGTVENYSSGHIKKYAKEKHGKTQGLLYSSKDEALAMVEEWKATIAQEGDTYDEVINITPQPQASVTVMDQYTGEIKAMVGGRGEKTTSLSLNRAYKGSKRQPGSCFKILAAYAPAFDTGTIGVGSIINDTNYKLYSGKVISGHNGAVTARKAIAGSLNSCAVQVSDMVTQEVGMEYCESFGISTLVKDKEINGKVYSDLGQTLALGGLTDGIYNYELCGAYAAIANGGTYHTPTMYTQILDHDGNVLLDGEQESHRVIHESVAYCLISCMKSVVNGGTGSACQLSNMAVAGKTGTTTSNKDLWFCGFTPYYTCAVWGGYDDNKQCNSDTRYRFRIWKGIMSRIHENLEYKDFEQPSTVTTMATCSYTGLLPGDHCPTSTELVATDVINGQRCDGSRHGNYADDEEEEDEEEEEEEEGKDDADDTGKNGNTDTGGGTGGSTTPTPTPDPVIPTPDPGTGGDTGGGTGGGDTGGGSTDTGGDSTNTDA